MAVRKECQLGIQMDKAIQFKYNQHYFGKIIHYSQNERTVDTSIRIIKDV